VGHAVGVIGATGAVGRELLGLFAQRGYPVDTLRVFASPESAGGELDCPGRGPLTLEAPSAEALAGCTRVFLCAGAEASRRWAPLAVDAGALVVDTSSAFRYEPEVPLVVPEVNPGAIPRAGLVASPNCTTALVVLALAPLHRLAGLTRLIVATYQAASGAGSAGLAELRAQTAAALAGDVPQAEVFPQPLAFNLFPHVDRFLPDEGWATREEMKLGWETRKLLELPELPCVATCVRVPVERAHSAAVFAEFAEALSVEDAQAALAQAPGVRLVDAPQDARYPTPLAASGDDPVLVGRVRKDPSCARGLAFFLSGDQLRKGAALNALQIAEHADR